MGSHTIKRIRLMTNNGTSDKAKELISKNTISSILGISQRLEKLEKRSIAQNEVIKDIYKLVKVSESRANKEPEHKQTKNRSIYIQVIDLLYIFPFNTMRPCINRIFNVIYFNLTIQFI